MVRAAVDAGELAVDPPTTVTVERPKNREHGDYATNVAMRLAKAAGKRPQEIAAIIASRLTTHDGIERVDIAGPGFLNITLSSAAQGEVVRQIVMAGKTYGHTNTLHGHRINVEFVSANPTGPLHLGHIRWAAVGDAIARALTAAGADVSREFYINDRGAQMDNFGASLRAAAHGRPVPESGYHGAYIVDLAKQIVADKPEILDLPYEDQVAAFREEAYARQLAEQQAVLEDFRTHFDVWFSERTLFDSGQVAHGIEVLRSQGRLYEKDGALWMRTTDFGDDRDRVIIRANGEPTYLAPDVAYYVNKRERGFDICIYLLGADHHGYVGRLKSIAAAAGDDPDKNIEVVIGQLVRITRGGQEVKLSKRAGTLVTFDEVVELTGVDALRYSLCRYPADSPLTLDVAAITKQVNENPVFYVQYVAARTASVSRNAADLGIGRGSIEDFSPGLLSHEKEGELLGVLGELPRVVATVAELREPHRVARYLEQLAAAYHRFYDECRILPRGDEEVSDLTRARLWLNDATRIAIENGLDLLGVTAPERM